MLLLDIDFKIINSLRTTAHLPLSFATLYMNSMQFLLKKEYLRSTCLHDVRSYDKQLLIFLQLFYGLLRYELGFGADLMLLLVIDNKIVNSLLTIAHLPLSFTIFIHELLLKKEYLRSTCLQESSACCIPLHNILSSPYKYNDELLRKEDQRSLEGIV
ncbi:uncharacterized protein LOC120359273 [Solenopsis invicta]|uniref:uncharacterized protein LOC120359273 n=1 Tax=Solenopsis invicta TaxID=13686 RepID=UPI00193EA245|nr:uncharacterized protein LOC120359273 [Solenopsis invicta]